MHLVILWGIVALKMAAAMLCGCLALGLLVVPVLVFSYGKEFIDRRPRVQYRRAVRRIDGIAQQTMADMARQAATLGGGRRGRSFDDWLR